MRPEDNGKSVKKSVKQPWKESYKTVIDGITNVDERIASYL